MWFFEWYGGLPTWARLLAAVPFLAVSAYFWFAEDRFWPYGWAAGVVMLLFAFPSRAAKKGYHDF